MATPTSSSHEANNSNRSREFKRKKRRKINFQDDDDKAENLKLDSTKWRTQAEQQIYYTKLVQALRQVRRNSSSSPLGSRTVRDTADRVLAVTAKGKTRWSRAILTGRLCLRMAHINNKHRKAATVSTDIRSRKPAVKKSQTPLQRKVRVLGRLVPGCRKISFPNLLQEATDYIAAREMQVRAMTALAGLLTPPAAGESLPTPNQLSSNQS